MTITQGIVTGCSVYIAITFVMSLALWGMSPDDGPFITLYGVGAAMAGLGVLLLTIWAWHWFFYCLGWKMGL